METLRTITMREHLIAQNDEMRDFFLGEWAREGYSADRLAAMIAGIRAIQLLESKDPELDQLLPVSEDLDNKAGIAVFSAAGRSYSVR